MSKKEIILGCYALTAVSVVGFLVYSAFQLDESSSIGLLFFPLYALGLFALFAWAESLLFMLLFAGGFREVRSLLLPVFLVSSVAPLWLLNAWYEQRPAPIPPPGTLPVTQEKYADDKEAISEDFMSAGFAVWSKQHRVDTVYDVRVDTIFYSKDLKQLFAFLFVSAISEKEHLYFNDYRVGSRSGEEWMLTRPKGNIWLTHFDSPDSMRITLLQYFYSSYSINGSDPDKPEIWSDAYIFPPGSR